MSYSHRADWYPLIAGYVAHLKAASLRPETIRLYRGWLWRAAAELPAPTTVRQRHVEAWLGEHDWAPETRKSIRTALRGFFRWLFEEGIIAEDPVRRLRVVRVPMAEPRPAPDAVMMAAFRAADDRLKLAILLAGRMGLRRAEIARAHHNDIVGDDLLVHGKGGTTRLVPIHPTVLPLLPEYGPLIPSLHDGGHVSPDCVGRMLSRALGEGVTGHMLRHRFASTAYAKGGTNLRAVQVALGHRTVNTTQRYVRADYSAVRAAVLSA